MTEATWTDVARAAGQARLVKLCRASVSSRAMDVSAWGWYPVQGTQDQAAVRQSCGSAPDGKSETFAVLPLCLYLLSGLGQAS